MRKNKTKKWIGPKLTVLLRGGDLNLLANCKAHPSLSGPVWSQGCTVVLQEGCYRNQPGCWSGRQCEPGCEPAIPGGSPGDAFWHCKLRYCADGTMNTRWALVQPNYTVGVGS